MSVAAIIVAAGRGERVGGAMPKQLAELAGRTLLQWSVQAFDRHLAVGSLVVVLPEHLVADGASLVGQTTRPCRIVAGGARRQDSVRLGLAAADAGADVLLVHDAARPFVSHALISRVVAGAASHGAAIPALPARDTVKRVHAGSRSVAETLARDEIWLAQTPQGFRRPVLEAAVALGGSVEATDEAMLAERAGLPVAIVDGDPQNFKITTPEDLARARAGAAGAVRIGTGYDLHRLVHGRPLVLAGVQIAAERGPAGHSDGDVVAHALIDALLGAAAAGDVGRLFPDNDPRWKDAPGLDLLARTMAALGEGGWRVANADVTVLLERPRLAPHLAAIRQAIAAVLQVEVGQVSVKAKTNEGVDAVGRGEAIAAHAVALVAGGTGR